MQVERQLSVELEICRLGVGSRIGVDVDASLRFVPCVSERRKAHEKCTRN